MGLLMLGLFLLMLIVAVSFGAGYATRHIVSRRRRANYLKWDPYIRSARRPAHRRPF
jgi:hypothetical protein